MTGPSARATSLALAALAAGALLAACGGGGGTSGPTGPTGPTGPSGPAAPDAVTGLAARATGPSSVSLTWTSPAGTLTGFEVERATAAAGPFAAAATPPGTATGFGDVALTTGVTYHYRVRALGDGGASPWSATASATPAADVPPTPPAAPSGLQVAQGGRGALVLSWADNASDETGYQVERSDAGAGLFAILATLGAGATGFTDVGLPDGRAYAYRVRAVNGVGGSEFTAAVTAATSTTPAPAAPTNLTARQELIETGAGTYTIYLRLAWTDAATDETGYEVERSLDGASWSGTESLPAGAISHLTTGASMVLNHFRVRAVNGGGGSAWASASVYNGPMVLPGFFCSQPLAPAASATSSTTVRVTWDWSTSCAQTSVERATSASGPWTEVHRNLGLFGFTPAWDDTGLSPGTTYHYRLRAIGYTADWRNSGYTATVSATPPVPAGPAAPTNLTATITSGSTATLAWTDASGDEDGFGVEYAGAAAGPYTQGFRAAANATQAFVNGLTPGSTTWFRVVALRGTSASGPSNAVAVTTPATVPFRATFDTSVVESTAQSSLQALSFPSDTNDVGCFYVWTVDLGANTYYMHNCAGSALRFDVSALAGKTITSAHLSMYACGLAPDPLDEATYVVRALAGPWANGVTFNALPDVYVAGGWQRPAPTSTAQQLWDVTTIVRNWASGAWANHGLFVEHSPVQDVRSFVWAGAKHVSQDQTTRFCSLEVTGGSLAYVPTLLVEYR